MGYLGHLRPFSPVPLRKCNIDFFFTFFYHQTYEEAQNKIDDDKDESSLTQGLRRLLKLSKIMKQKRIDAGALQLASSEVR